MSYETVIEKVRSIPEERLSDVENFIDSLSQGDKPFIFDNLVCHTERADSADKYIRELRDSDRF